MHVAINLHLATFQFIRPVDTGSPTTESLDNAPENVPQPKEGSDYVTDVKVRDRSLTHAVSFIIMIREILDLNGFPSNDWFLQVLSNCGSYVINC